MLQELQLTPATIILIAAIVAWIVWAIRRLVKRGMCDCHDGECEGCSGCGHKSVASGECVSCGAVDKMIANMEKESKANSTK